MSLKDSVFSFEELHGGGKRIDVRRFANFLIKGGVFTNASYKRKREVLGGMYIQSTKRRDINTNKTNQYLNGGSTSSEEEDENDESLPIENDAITQPGQQSPILLTDEQIVEEVSKLPNITIVLGAGNQEEHIRDNPNYTLVVDYDREQDSTCKSPYGIKADFNLEMTILRPLLGKVDLVVFDRSTSKFWKQDLSHILPLLKPTGQFVIELDIGAISPSFEYNAPNLRPSLPNASIRPYDRGTNPTPNDNKFIYKRRDESVGYVIDMNTRKYTIDIPLGFFKRFQTNIYNKKIFIPADLRCIQSSGLCINITQDPAQRLVLNKVLVNRLFLKNNSIESITIMPEQSFKHPKKFFYMKTGIKNIETNTEYAFRIKRKEIEPYDEEDDEFHPQFDVRIIYREDIEEDGFKYPVNYPQTQGQPYATMIIQRMW
jgi:hypothetical protein